MNELDKATHDFCAESKHARWICDQHVCDDKGFILDPSAKLLESGALVEVELHAVPNDTCEYNPDEEVALLAMVPLWG